jgi:hypothetical protein
LAKKKKIKDKSLEWRVGHLEKGVEEYVTFKDHVNVRVELGHTAAIAIQCHKDNLEGLKAYFAKLIVNLLQLAPAPPKPTEDPAKTLQKYLNDQSEVSDAASSSPIYQ